MKKRNIRLLSLCILLSMVLISACGKTENASNKNENKDLEAADDGKSEEQEGVFEEQVLLDDGGFKITAVEYIEKYESEEYSLGDGEYEAIKILVESSYEEEKGLGANSFALNNYSVYQNVELYPATRVDDLSYIPVNPGEAVEAYIVYDASELKRLGMGNVGQVSATITLGDKKDIYTGEEPYISIHTDIKTPYFKSWDENWKPDDVGTEIYNNNGLIIYGRLADNPFLEDSSSWDACDFAYLYVENNVDVNSLGDSLGFYWGYNPDDIAVSIWCEDTSVDGETLEGSVSLNGSVARGKKGLIIGSWSPGYYGITKMDSADMNIGIEYSLRRNILLPDTITKTTAHFEQ